MKRTKEERDLILYGTFNRLLHYHCQALKGRTDAPRAALTNTYEDVSILFNIDPITIRHILGRMEKEKNREKDAATPLRLQANRMADTAVQNYYNIVKKVIALP